MNLTHARIIGSLLTVAAIGCMIVTSITPPAQAESNHPLSSEQGAWLIISHNVVDYKRWLPVHERSAATKRQYGWSKGAVFSIDGDKNHIMVMEQFATLERARAYADSNQLRDEMAASGVSSNPEIRFAKNLNGEPTP